MNRLAIVVAILIGCLLTSAQAQWLGNGETVPDTPWRKYDGDFWAMLLVTNDPDGFFDRWNQQPSPYYKSALTPVSTAMRGENVMAVVIFTGCAAKPNGDCDSQIDFKVLSPNGTVYVDLKDGELWTGEPPPESHNLQVSVACLGLTIEDEGPFGTYHFEALVRDNIGDKQLKLIQTLEVVKK